MIFQPQDLRFHLWVAAIGKIGAFAGVYAFPESKFPTGCFIKIVRILNKTFSVLVIARFPAGPAQSSGPFYVGSGLAILSAIIVFFLIPEVSVLESLSTTVN